MSNNTNTRQCSVKITENFHDIEATLWDSIVPTEDIFHTHRFIKAVVDAKVENSEFRFLLFYAGEQLVGSTVLSLFPMQLDVLAGDDKFIKTLKKWFPKWMAINVIWCGLPASLGQHNLVIADKQHKEQILTLLNDTMNAWSKEKRVKFQIAKEFLADYDADTAHLAQLGFFKCDSIPYMKMDIEWNSFEEYIGALRNNYRKKIKRSLKLINRNQPKPIPYSTYNSQDSTPQLVEGGASMCSPAQFYELYLTVMERTTAKLETFNVAFFENFYENMRENMHIVALLHQGKVLAAVILMQHGDYITGALAGHINREDDPFDAYFNIYNAMIQLSIAHDCKHLHLGQTAYMTKQRLGAQATDEFFYFKSTNRILHWLMQKFKSSIFPKLTLEPIRAFRD